MKKRLILVLSMLLLIIAMSACRNETQNRLRRSLQDFTSDKMYITIYTIDGTSVFEGIVDGKVTRASDQLSNTSDRATGSYIYWFDEKGRYHQTDMPYFVTSYDRTAPSQ